MTATKIGLPSGLSPQEKRDLLRKIKRRDVLRHRVALLDWRASPRYWRCDRPSCDGRPHVGHHHCDHPLDGPHKEGCGHARRLPGRSQVAPDSDWRIRYLQGGRGSGKGFGASNTFADLILDADPGEWACIGPTFGDARDVMIQGPSGLIRALGGVPGVGGTLLSKGPWIKRWNVSTGQLFLNNGSVVYTDGADDGALRIQGKNLRGAWCLAAGTSITTRGGTKPIEDVAPGDEVLTRTGWRPVLATVCTNPRAETIRISLADGTDVRCTPDHPVWIVGAGWSEARWVTPGDSLLQVHPPGTTTEGGGSTAGTPVTTSQTTASFLDGFTRRSGRTRTARRSRKVTRSITRISTRRTTTRRTSSSSPVGSTCVSTAAPSGTPRLAPGSKLGSRRRGSVAPLGRFAAFGAAGTSTLASARTSATAQSGAVAPTSDPSAPLSTPGRQPSDHATSAATGSCPRTDDPGSAPLHVGTPISVVAVRPDAPIDVYDLTVEDAHEFVANGVLVHNCDEIGLWARGNPKARTPMWKVAWEESIKFAVRLAPAKIVASGTPKANRSARELVARLIDDPAVPTDVLWTEDNLANLLPEQVEEWMQHAGTRLGQQELRGTLLTDVEGALVTWDDIIPFRVNPDEVPPLRRVLVTYDPSFSTAEDADESGIAAIAEGVDHHAYVLADRSGRHGLDRGAKMAVRLAWDVQANGIVYESNMAGEVVRDHLLAAINDLTSNPDAWADIGGRPDGWHAPRLIPAQARLPKQGRLEVVAPLWQQHRVHHVGRFDALETQITSWVPGESGYSPDRMDAVVQGVAELGIHRPVRGRRISMSEAIDRAGG